MRAIIIGVEDRRRAHWAIVCAVCMWRQVVVLVFHFSLFFFKAKMNAWFRRWNLFAGRDRFTVLHLLTITTGRIWSKITKKKKHPRQNIQFWILFDFQRLRNINSGKVRTKMGLIFTKLWNLFGNEGLTLFYPYTFSFCPKFFSLLFFFLFDVFGTGGMSNIPNLQRNDLQAVDCVLLFSATVPFIE